MDASSQVVDAWFTQYGFASKSVRGLGLRLIIIKEDSKARLVRLKVLYSFQRNSSKSLLRGVILANILNS